MNSGLYFLTFHSLFDISNITADITQNPFASSNSLDRNPFEDPFTSADADQSTSPYAHELNATRSADLDQRERDLERRERELHQKSEHIRRHGRNNFPPCPFFVFAYAF